MPFNGSGEHSLPPGTIVADGMTVQPSQHNPPFLDVSASLSQTLLRSGVAPMTGNLNMNSFKVMGVSEGEDPGDVVTMAQIADLAVDIGDGKWSIRDLSPNWLRRDGGIYDISEYPELAALLPALPDGVQWSPQQPVPTITGVFPSGLAFGNGIYIAGSSEGHIFTSTALVSWNTIDLGDALGSFRKSVFGAGTFILVSSTGAVATSLNGSAWSDYVINGSASFYDVVWTGTRFIIVGDNGSGGPIMYESNTGASGSWTTISTPATSSFRSIAYDSGKAIAVGASGEIITSADGGTTWTARSSGVIVTLNSVVIETGTNNAVAVGTGGVILSSSNLGAAWTSRSSGVATALNTVVVNEIGWLTIGASGVALISDEMVSWSGAPTGTGNNFIGAVVDPDSPDNSYVILSFNRDVLRGVRTLSTQFQVPNDNPDYGWIRAI